MSNSHQTTDPFEPGPRREEVHGARFWPDTLFVDLSEYPDEVQSYDHHELAFWDDCNLGILVAMAARMHEQLHWLQTVGTTFGRFLATNRVTTGDLADAILTTATPRELGLLIDARRRSIPPALRDRTGRLSHEIGYSSTLQSLFDHWWSTVALEHYLVDSGADLLGPIDPRFMVGLSMRYAVAGNRPIDVFNAPDAGFMEATRDFGPRDASRTYKAASGLTVRHIEETAALVLQLITKASLAEMLTEQRQSDYAAQTSRWSLERFLDDRQSLYTKALLYYAEHVPATDPHRFFELLLLICDIALNPRIPDDGSPLGSDWSDFHPVCRFERLVAALEGFVPDTRKVDGHPSPQWWEEERYRLVKRAGISDGAKDRSFCSAPKVTPDALEAPSDHIRAFLAKAGANLTTLRERYPSAVVSPIHALIGDTDGLVALTDTFDGPSFDPPLNIRSFGDGEPSPSIDTRSYVHTLFALTSRRATHSWLVRAGSLNFQGLPTDTVGLKAQQAAIERLSQLYGIET
ncbi:hypothetical protein [Sphingobium cupriresistens]|uniref:hypothetical protein n=1 Tax=Sphingobium cupriresistens TaxID=1132417 RepID=UPI003BF4A191